MAVQALPRRRSTSWLLWLMVLALAGLGGYGLSNMDRDQVPESGMHAAALLAVQDPQQGRASVDVPPTVSVTHEAFVQEDSDQSGEPAAPMPPPEVPAASPPVSAVPGAAAQNAGSRPAPAGMECGDALAAMQLCAVSSSR